MSSIILALALAVAPFTAIRSEAGYGPTDLLLLIAVVFSAASGLRHWAASQSAGATADDQHGIQSTRPTAIYWIFAIFFIAVSSVANWPFLVRLESPIVLLAGYAVSFAIVIALYLQASSSGIRTVVIAYNFFSLLIILVYLAGYFGGFDQFFFYYRFVGLSENPNQTALHMFCILIAATAALGKLEVHNFAVRAGLMLNILLSIIIGVLTVSDAFVFAVVVMIAVGTAHLLLIRAAASGTGFVMIFFMLAPLVVVSILYLVDFEELSALALEQIQMGNQDSDRWRLWKNGIVAWQDSWLIGHGPGGWSGFAGPYEGNEAHNTIIDIMTITGVLGLIAYLGLLLALFRRRLSGYLWSHYCMLGLMVFSLFHFTLRHPVFWFAIILIYMPSLYRRSNGETAERFMRWRRPEPLHPEPSQIAIRPA